MEKLTKLEVALMETIPNEEFYEEGFESLLWSNSLLDALEDHTGIYSKQARGVFSSLVKKGFIKVRGTNGEELIELKANGIEWMKENLELDEEGYKL